MIAILLAQQPMTLFDRRSALLALSLFTTCLTDQLILTLRHRKTHADHNPVRGQRSRPAEGR